MKDDIRLLTVVTILNTAGLALIIGFVLGVITLLITAHAFHG